MKKIKKLQRIKFLSEKEEKTIMGGQCEIEGCGVGVLDVFGYFHSTDPGPVGGSSGGGNSGQCGCSYCSSEEGGFGFSVGMMIRGRSDMG